jgi:hypothetical protein
MSHSALGAAPQRLRSASKRKGQLVMTDWKTIETAPKDGTWVHLAGGTIDYGYDDGNSVPSVVSAQWGDVYGRRGWQPALFFRFEDEGCDVPPGAFSG